MDFSHHFAYFHRITPHGQTLGGEAEEGRSGRGGEVWEGEGRSGRGGLEGRGGLGGEVWEVIL